VGKGKNMKIGLRISFFILLSILTLLNLSYAFRIYPEIQPVVDNGIKYTAVSFSATIEAWDIKRNLKLWDLQVYDPSEFYEKNRECDSNGRCIDIEGDLQFNCITSMELRRNKLIITNERGGVYEVDPQSKKIVKVKEEVIPDKSIGGFQTLWPSAPAIDFTISSDKKSYKLGEKTKITGEIKNACTSQVCFVKQDIKFHVIINGNIGFNEFSELPLYENDLFSPKNKDKSHLLVSNVCLKTGEKYMFDLSNTINKILDEVGASKIKGNVYLIIDPIGLRGKIRFSPPLMDSAISDSNTLTIQFTDTE
jgi:hypothetical protein